MMDAEIARELLKSLDNIAAWLAKISGQLAAQDKATIEQFGRVRDVLDILVAQSLPGSPEVTEEVTVLGGAGVAPTLLIKNDSVPLLRVNITNDDPAQPLWVGTANVLPTMGRVVIAQTTIPYVLPLGAEVWGVCVVGFISVRIEKCYDLLGRIEAGT